MRDLTQGSIARHIVTLTAPIIAGMIFQALYYVVDLYFIALLGGTAVAGAVAAANATYLVLALSQVLGVGAAVSIAHAAGRRDKDAANLVFNQSLTLAGAFGLLVLLIGYGLTRVYLQGVGADSDVVDAGTTYLYWFMPGLALQFAVVAMAAALRGIGVVRPAVVVQALTVIVNVVLAPILVVGWVTHYPLGVAGAGLASTLAAIVGVALLWIYIARRQHYLVFDRRQWRPRVLEWQRMLKIGLPAGGEFALLFVYTAVTYWAVREFGAVEQAGLGVGTRILQVALMPVMAVAMAVASVAGQNFGAGRGDRVRQALRVAVFFVATIMLSITLLVQWRPAWLAGAFSGEPDVIAAAAEYLRLLSWSFVGYGLVFACSGMFQGLGDTRPALLTSVLRVGLFALAVAWLSVRPDFRPEQVWYAAVATAWLQALVSLFVLLSVFRRRILSSAAAAASLRSAG